MAPSSSPGAKAALAASCRTSSGASRKRTCPRTTRAPGTTPSCRWGLPLPRCSTLTYPGARASSGASSSAPSRGMRPSSMPKTTLRPLARSTTGSWAMTACQMLASKTRTPFWPPSQTSPSIKSLHRACPGVLLKRPAEVVARHWLPVLPLTRPQPGPMTKRSPGWSWRRMAPSPRPRCPSCPRATRSAMSGSSASLPVSLTSALWTTPNSEAPRTNQGAPGSMTCTWGWPAQSEETWMNHASASRAPWPAGPMRSPRGASQCFRPTWTLRCPSTGRPGSSPLRRCRSMRPRTQW
mmetsp:Transcript_14029/g.41177  ORF Transcript_14029/g.41177 Transcript_14029/m.41177 type:complete len:295 (-) Transcript_14029:724-1608(-)